MEEWRRKICFRCCPWLSGLYDHRTKTLLTVFGTHTIRQPADVQMLRSGYEVMDPDPDEPRLIGVVWINRKRPGLCKRFFPSFLQAHEVPDPPAVPAQGWMITHIRNAEYTRRLSCQLHNPDIRYETVTVQYLIIMKLMNNGLMTRSFPKGAMILYIVLTFVIIV